MKKLFTSALFPVLFASLMTCGCKRSSDEVWNDTKTAGRHVSRGVKSLGGKHGDSRQVRSSSEFMAKKGQKGADDYVAFEDESQALDMRVGDETAVNQPRETPGELGSSIPSIDSFKDPSQSPELVAIFENVQFDYNSSLVEGNQNIRMLQKMADWMKAHPRVYIFVEGHCDSRGPAAYNFALGANRANAVRNFLIKDGVSHDHIFTISYGKERPLVDGDGEEIWKVNRRAQFKVYEK